MQVEGIARDMITLSIEIKELKSKKKQVDDEMFEIGEKIKKPFEHKLNTTKRVQYIYDKHQVSFLQSYEKEAFNLSTFKKEHPETYKKFCVVHESAPYTSVRIAEKRSKK